MAKSGYMIEKRKLLDQERAYELWCKGMSDWDIAEELGMSDSCVGSWRRRNKLKPNRDSKDRPKKKRLSKNMSKLSQDAAAAREAGMNYGVWKARQWEVAGRPRQRRFL